MSRRLHGLLGLVWVVLGDAGVQAADRVLIPGSGVNLVALPFTLTGGGPYTAGRRGMAHTGPNADARADSLRRVTSFVRE
jgi:hypothetical protein